MSNPKKRRVRRNPKARKAASTRSRVRAVRRNPAPRRHARRRRNPIGLGSARTGDLFKSALVGALGATAVNTILANLGSALPASLTTGNMSYVTRAALSVAIAMIGRKSGKAGLFAQAAEGSLTVTMHDAIVSLSAGAGMSLAGGRMGMYMPGRVSQVVPTAGARAGQTMSGMSAYLTGGGSPQARAQIGQRQAIIAAQPQHMSGFGF